MNIFKAAFAAAALSFVSGAAGAASLSLKNYDPSGSDLYGTHTIGSNFDLDNQDPDYLTLTSGLGTTNDVLAVILSGNKSDQNGLQVDGPAKVTYTYLGKEAAFQNKFAAGSTIFTGSSSVGDSGAPTNVLAGLLDFELTSNGTGDYVRNHGNATNGMNIAYLLFNKVNGVFRSALVFLDDYAGFPNIQDADFDDIAVRVDVTAVPLPPSAIMLVTALGGLGLLGRRRRQARS